MIVAEEVRGRKKGGESAGADQISFTEQPV